MGTLQIEGWQTEVVDGLLETRQTWNSNLQTLNLECKYDNFGMANSSWKCTFGNKTNMIFQFPTLKQCWKPSKVWEW
jgi:hypothetical protein